MPQNIHLGHRARMRRKFAEYGDEIFDEYELLEMILYFSVPVRDTNPLAKILMNEFGSLRGVLSASKEDLMKVNGVGETTARMLVDISNISLYTDCNPAKKMQMTNYHDLGSFFTKLYSERGDYCVGLLSLDSDLRVIAYDELYQNNFDSAAVRPSVFADAAVRRGASLVVIAHNHPHGPLYPSEGDMETNTLIVKALADIGVSVAEHIIVVGTRYLGFMRHMPSAFSDENSVFLAWGGKLG